MTARRAKVKPEPDTPPAVGTVSKKLQFHTGLPLGECALFTHEGRRWIAAPSDTHTRLGTVIDRLLGSISWACRELTHPADQRQRVIDGLRLAYDEACANKGPRVREPEPPVDDSEDPLF